MNDCSTKTCHHVICKSCLTFTNLTCFYSNVANGVSRKREYVVLSSCALDIVSNNLYKLGKCSCVKLSPWFCTRVVRYFCPFVVKATRITAIFQLYNVLHFIKQIFLMMFTKFKLFSLAITYVLCIFLAYLSYTEIQQIWSYIDIEITCMKELLVTSEILRTHMVRCKTLWVCGMWLFVVLDSPVTIWPYTLSSKFWYLHVTIVMPFHYLGTILTYLRCLSFLLNALKLENASFYYSRKLFPILFVVRNWYYIVIKTISTSVKTVLGYKIRIYVTENLFKCGSSCYI